MSSRLTILLPLKGRPLHTLRFFWDAARRRLPYRFVVGDGEVHPAIAAVFERARTVFPHVDVDYVRFPDDVSFSHFFVKMATIADMVRTPYVMQIDNDDFLVRSGLEHSMEFLDRNPDFVSHGGGIGGFSIDPAGAALPKVVGAPEHLTFRYGENYVPRDLSEPLAAERVRDGFKRYAIYYHVFRTDVLAKVLAEIRTLDFSDLELHETYFCMRALTLGKSRLDGTTMSYFRQIGTSSATAHRGYDWVGHLLRSRFTADFDAMVETIAIAIAKADGCDSKAAAESLRNLYGEKLRADLRVWYGRRPYQPRSRYHPISLAKVALRSLALGWTLELYRRRKAAWRLDPARRDAQYRAERTELLNELSRHGATASYVAAFAQEWSAIEASLDEPSFLAFLRAQAPELLDNAAVLRQAEDLAA
jgi:glycosyltransferase domain-containing protein